MIRWMLDVIKNVLTIVLSVALILAMVIGVFYWFIFS